MCRITGDASAVEFHRNEGSWCAGNAITELSKMFEGANVCPCSIFECEFLDDVDTNPRIKENES